MINRVTSSSISANLVLNMQKNYADYAKLTEQISLGKKIESILDNPTESINIINANRELNKIAEWKSNITYLTNELNQSSDTLDFIIDKSQRAKDLATISANKTYNKDNLNSILTEVDLLIESVVDMANTKDNGNYIYSGVNTNTPPYEIQYDNNGEITGIEYNGSSKDNVWKRKLEIGEGIFQTVNVTGIEVFGESDFNGESSGIMGDLIDLRNNLKNTISKLEEQENLPENATQAEKDKIVSEINSCYESINGLLDNFDNSINNITGINSRIGAVTNKLEMTSNTLENTSINIESEKSDIENIDLTKAISEWYMSQYAYQASMQVFQASNSMSLLNYI